MINTVALCGRIVDVRGCETHILAILECNEEQFYILFEFSRIPEPNKLKNKYVSINGVLQHFKHKPKYEEEYTIELGIFVRRLEVYDL